MLDKSQSSLSCSIIMSNSSFAHLKVDDTKVYLSRIFLRSVKHLIQIDSKSYWKNR